MIMMPGKVCFGSAVCIIDPQDVFMQSIIPMLDDIHWLTNLLVQ